MNGRRTYREVVYEYVTGIEPLTVAHGNRTLTIEPNKVTIEIREGEEPTVRVQGRIVRSHGEVSTRRATAQYGRYGATPVAQAPAVVQELVAVALRWPGEAAP